MLLLQKKILLIYKKTLKYILIYVNIDFFKF